MSGRQTVVFDDRDVTHIQYSGSWSAGGTDPPSVTPSNLSTYHFSNDIGVQFAFTFPQPAVSFTYFGFHRCCGGFYGICIDCDPGNPQWQNIDAVLTSDDGTGPPVALFNRDFNTSAIHTVVVRNQADQRFNGTSQIIIDRLELIVDPQASSSVASSSPSSSSSTTSGRDTTITGNPSPNPVSNSKPIGAIVGGVVGGIAVVIAALFLFLWLRKRERRGGRPVTVPLDATTGGDQQTELLGYQVSHPYPQGNQQGHLQHQQQFGGPASTPSGWSTMPMQQVSSHAEVALHVMGGPASEPPPAPAISESGYTSTHSSSRKGLVTQFPTNRALSPSLPFAASNTSELSPTWAPSVAGSGSGMVQQEVDAGPVTESERRDTVLPPGYEQVFGNRRG